MEKSSEMTQRRQMLENWKDELRNHFRNIPKEFTDPLIRKYLSQPIDAEKLLRMGISNKAVGLALAQALTYDGVKLLSDAFDHVNTHDDGDVKYAQEEAKLLQVMRSYLDTLISQVNKEVSVLNLPLELFQKPSIIDKSKWKTFLLDIWKQLAYAAIDSRNPYFVQNDESRQRVMITDLFKKSWTIPNYFLSRFISAESTKTIIPFLEWVVKAWRNKNKDTYQSLYLEKYNSFVARLGLEILLAQLTINEMADLLKLWWEENVRKASDILTFLKENKELQQRIEARRNEVSEPNDDEKKVFHSFDFEVPITPTMSPDPEARNIWQAYRLCQEPGLGTELADLCSGMRRNADIEKYIQNFQPSTFYSVASPYLPTIISSPRLAGLKRKTFK